jgi:hypothetical protein
MRGDSCAEEMQEKNKIRQDFQHNLHLLSANPIRSDNKKFTFPEKIQKQNLLADKQPYKQSLASNLRLQTSDSIYRVNTYAAVVCNHQK